MDEVRNTTRLDVRDLELPEDAYRMLLVDGRRDGKSRLSKQDMDPGGPEVERRGRADMH